MNQMRNFFNRGSGGGQNFLGRFGNAMKVFSMFKQFMQNPLSAFFVAGLDIPQNVQNNPEAITNYLRSSGKMTEDQYNQSVEAARFAQNIFGGLFGKR